MIEELIAEAMRAERAHRASSVPPARDRRLPRRPRGSEFRRRVGLALVRCGARIAGVRIVPHPG